jgi:DNA-binding beta-propeller fold protein YncE
MFVLSMVAGATVMTRGADTVFTLISTVELPRVEGRIDHLAFDAARDRLYVAALGNNTVEVLDTKALTHLTSLPGFAEPQGIVVASDARLVGVANRRSGRVQLFNTDSQQPGNSLQPGDNADNLRYDSVAKRVYVGYGNGAIAAIDPASGKVLGQAAVAGHPESFQLERSGARIFVNVPTANQIAVVDRAAMKVIATWPVTSAAACFPMALDETNHRLFIGCRRPANVLVFDTETGKQVSAFEIVGDTDDLFYDAGRKRLYVIGGEGFLDAIEEPSANRFVRIAHLPTAAGARTGLFTPDQGRLYLAVPHRDNQRADIRVYAVH